MLETPNLNRVSRYPFLQWLRDAQEVVIWETAPRAGGRVFEVHLKNKRESKVTVPPPPEYGVEALLGNARLLETSGDYILARTLYSYILAQKDARNTTALFGAAICLFQLRDIASAFHHFQQVAELSSQPESFLWMAKCRAIQGKDLSAIEYLTRITQWQSLPALEQFEYHKLLGNCLLRMGRLNEAENAFKTAIGIQPSHDGIKVNLGMLELERSGFSNAVSYFESALTLNPRNVKALTGLGLAALSQQDGVHATAYFERALDLDPQSATALVQLLSLPGVDVRQASERVERLLELDSDNRDVRYHIAAWYFDHSNWKECEKHLTRIIQADPTHAKAQSLLSEMRKKFQKAGGVS